VLQVKKALDSIAKGTVLTVVDNNTALENISLYAKNAGYEASAEKSGQDYHITITKGGPGNMPGNQKITVNQQPDKTPMVYFFSSNLLGEGSPDLGQVLMKSLMVTINEMTPPPMALLFLNSGVMSACEGSSVLEQLHSLAAKGVTIISCGTCLDYYKLKEKLQVGRVGNMLDINGYLDQAAKVVTIA